MTSTHPPSRRAGFTLIELLVVIAIIAILAALGFGAGAAAINRAKKLTAANDCTNLVQGINGYFQEYSHYPEVSGGNADTTSLTDSSVMNILLGLGSNGQDQNPKQIRYYQGREAKGANGREYGGLLRQGNSAELFDPWRKVGGGQIRHYKVRWDGNYDEEIDDPFNSGKKLFRTVIAWSTGKDGEETLGSAGNSKNRDNVYSWGQ